MIRKKVISECPLAATEFVIDMFLLLRFLTLYVIFECSDNPFKEVL